jgi:hypothetical protein
MYTYDLIVVLSHLGDKRIRYFCWQCVFLFPSSDGEFTFKKKNK